MALVKVDNHYVTDIRFFLLKKYKDVYRSDSYYVIKGRFEARTCAFSSEAKIKYAESCIRKCIKMYNYGKKKNDENIMRRAAIVTFAVLDSV